MKTLWSVRQCFYYNTILIIFNDYYNTMGGWREIIFYELLKTTEEKGK